MIDTQVPVGQHEVYEPRPLDRSYRWMFLAMAITGFISVSMVTAPLISGLVLVVASDVAGFVWLIALELLLVGYLAPALPRRPALSVGSAFLGIALLNGMIFSFVLLYSGRSLDKTFPFTLYEGLVSGGWLWRHIGFTLETVLYGFFAAVILGIPLGVALGSTRSWQQLWQPAIESMYAVPKTMLYPIFILLFGVGIGSRIAIAFSHALLPIVSSAMTSAAARSASIVTGLAPAVRAGLSLALIGVVLSEMYASTQGLGLLLILSARERDGVNRVLAIILLLFLLLLLVNISFRALEKRLQTNAEPK